VNKATAAATSPIVPAGVCINPIKTGADIALR
jgi:hypothetical protein